MNNPRRKVLNSSPRVGDTARTTPENIEVERLGLAGPVPVQNVVNDGLMTTADPCYGCGVVADLPQGEEALGDIVARIVGRLRR